MWGYFLYPNIEKMPKRVETPTYFLYPNIEKMPKKVETPTSAGRISLPKWRKIGERGREVKYRSSGNLYPNSGKLAKRVEIPVAAGRISLPKPPIFLI